MYECVIFDVDGTLIDTEKAAILSLQKVLKEETSAEYSSEDLSFIMGLTGVEALQRLGVKNTDAMNELWNRYLKNYFHLISVFADIEEMLKDLSEIGIKTGIVTSKTEQELSDDLGPFKLRQYFSYAVCSDHTQKHKPDPEPIAKFIKIAKVKPAKTIYIGDTVNDLLAARGAGVDFGLALWGTGGQGLSGSKYQFANPREIIGLMKGNKV